MIQTIFIKILAYVQNFGEICGLGLAIFLVLLIIFIASQLIHKKFDDSEEEEHIRNKNNHIKK